MPSVQFRLHIVQISYLPRSGSSIVVRYKMNKNNTAEAFTV